MLTHLLIKNFAVVEELELDLRAGMTVFTGETGAGKSILIDSSGLVLGDRADSGIIRSGCDRTEICANFSVSEQGEVADILRLQDIELDDNEVLIRRVINADGRSRAFINGVSVPVNLLRRIGEHMIDIHGQHAHQSLTRREAQRTLLDDYGDHEKELKAVAELAQEWQELESQISSLSGSSDDHRAKISLLRYQVQELEELSPAEGEYEELNEEFKRLDNAKRLIELAQNAVDLLAAGEQSADSVAARALRDLQEARQFDERLGSAIELVDGAVIQLSEAADELRLYLGKVDVEPENLGTVEKRLSDFHDIARKHNIPSQQLAAYFSDLQGQLFELENSEHLLDELLLKKESCLTNYQSAALALSTRREKTANRLGKEVSKTLASLGMPGGEFLVSVEGQADTRPNAFGSDAIEFLVSANPGQPPQPLRKVASGGELSRISLAIQVISNNQRVIPTLVFDEVDSGIGGGIAEIVGKLLHQLTDKHQVFCVTHLPQVASLADHHLQVQKHSGKKSTSTAVAELDDEERIEEIARMLGGVKITEQSRKHAREMLN